MKSETLTLERVQEVKKEAQKLFNTRYAMAYCDGFGAPDLTSLRIVNDDFDTLADELEISPEALEFLLNPVGIRDILDNTSITNRQLTRGERVVENVNVKLAQELRSKGLL